MLGPTPPGSRTVRTVVLRSVASHGFESKMAALAGKGPADRHGARQAFLLPLQLPKGRMSREQQPEVPHSGVLVKWGPGSLPGAHPGPRNPFSQKPSREPSRPRAALQTLLPTPAYLHVASSKRQGMRRHVERPEANQHVGSGSAGLVTRDHTSPRRASVSSRVS